jgi:hypothetical protein
VRFSINWIIGAFETTMTQKEAAQWTADRNGKVLVQRAQSGPGKKGSSCG